MSALVNLGFRPQDVEEAIRAMGEDVDLQSGIRQGLQLLTGQVTISDRRSAEPMN